MSTNAGVLPAAATPKLSGIAGLLAFHASKEVLPGMTKVWAGEYGCTGVRVNAASSGAIIHPLQRISREERPGRARPSSGTRMGSVTKWAVVRHTLGVREPLPFGVLIAVHVPAFTSFQALP